MSLGRVLHNASALTAMRAVTALASFALLVYLTRHWPPAVLGAFSTLNAIYLILLPVPLLGLHVPLIRDAVATPLRVPALGSAALTFALAVAFLAAVVVGAFVMLSYPRELWIAGWCVAATAIPTAYTQVNDSLLLARERMNLWAWIAVAEVVSRSLAWAILAWSGFGITACFVALFIFRCGAALAYRLLAPDARLLSVRAVDLNLVRYLAALVPTFAGILLASTLMQRLDFLMLSRWSTMTAVGTYAAPYRVFEAIQTLPTIVAMALFPVLARAAALQDGGASLRLIVGRCVAVIAALGVPGAIVLGWSALPLTVLLFGSKFAQASVVLVWLAVVPVIWSVDQILSSVLQSSHAQRRDAGVWVAGCAIYALLLRALIPQFGIAGAAAATFLAVAIQCGIRMVVARDVVPIATVAVTLLRPIAAGLLMLGTLWVLRSAPLYLSLTAGLVVYLGAAAALGVVRSRELVELRAAMARQEIPL